YTSVGVTWNDIQLNSPHSGIGGNAGFGNGANSFTSLIPGGIHALAFDQQGRLIVATDEGIYRGVPYGFANSNTSANPSRVYPTGGGGGGFGGGNNNVVIPTGMTFTAINGNLQIADLTSVAADPTSRSTFYTTAANTGTALTTGGLKWTTSGLAI